MPTKNSRSSVDFLLTKIAQGYAVKPDQYVGSLLFPNVEVEKMIGKYMKYNKDQLIDRTSIASNTRHGLAASIDYSKSTAPYELLYYALRSDITQDELEESSPETASEIEKERTDLLTNGMALLREKQIADLVQTDTNYDATNKKILDGTAGKYYWSDTTNGTPIEDIGDAIDAVRSDIGEMITTMVFGWQSAVQLQKHDDVKKLANPVSNPTGPVTVNGAIESIAKYFGIKNYAIGMPQYTTEPTGTLTDIWADNVILAHVGDLKSKKTQNFGAMLNRKGYPKMYKTVDEEKRDLLIIQIQAAFQAHAINWDAGYLIKNTKA
jgi:hypothetical protein